MEIKIDKQTATAIAETCDRLLNGQPPVAGAAICSVTRELQYIADSPDQQYGGFHIHAVMTAKKALLEIRRLRLAIRWALGERGEFAQQQPGQGAYWWRTELRRRAGVSPKE